MFTGIIEEVGRVADIAKQNGNRRLTVAVSQLTRELQKGVSLPVAQIEGPRVTAAIIPHTVKMTNLKSLQAGDPINLEVDMVAKYVEKMLKGESASSSLTVKRLVREGF